MKGDLEITVPGVNILLLLKSTRIPIRNSLMKPHKVAEGVVEGQVLVLEVCYSNLEIVCNHVKLEISLKALYCVVDTG